MCVNADSTEDNGNCRYSDLINFIFIEAGKRLKDLLNVRELFVRHAKNKPKLKIVYNN